MVAFGVVAGTLVASAQSDSSSDSGSSGAATATDDGARDHRGWGGDEVTGATARRVRAVAREAVPGGTVERVVEGRDGGYAAFVTKADGSRVVVKVSEGFEVTDITTCDGDRSGGSDTGSS